MGIFNLEQTGMVIAICSNLSTFTKTADEGPQGLLDDAEELTAFVLDRSSPDEMATAFQIHKRLMGLQAAMDADRKEKMLAPELYLRTEDGSRRLQEYVNGQGEFTDYLLTLFTQIAKFPRIEHREKLRRVFARAAKS